MWPASQHTSSAGSSYSGQTMSVSGAGVHAGSCQTSVLVKVGNQRAQEQVVKPPPQALWEKS